MVIMHKLRVLSRKIIDLRPGCQVSTLAYDSDLGSPMVILV